MKKWWWIGGIASIVLSGMLGYYMAASAPEILQDEATDAISSGDKTTFNCNFTRKYNYEYCGHSMSVDKVGEFIGVTKAELREKGFKVTKFSADNVVLEFNFAQYCPNHYILKEENSSLVVMRCLEYTAELEVYQELNQSPLTFSTSEKQRLSKGIVFATYEDLEEYLNAR